MDKLFLCCSVKLSHIIPTAQPSLFFGFNEDQVILKSEERFCKCIFTNIHILYEHLRALSILKKKSER